MVLSPLSVALGSLALLGFLGLCAWQRRRPLPPRLRAGALLALTGLAFVFHLGLPREGPDASTRWSAPLPHPNEYLLYYLGTKYFAEVGYTGLYAAGVVADWEDAREDFEPDAPVRDLASYRLVPRSSVLPDADRIRARFGPERWHSFKQELAVLRATAPPEFWHQSGYYVDHGYNGTPLITAISGGLASQPFLDTATFIDLARFLDLYLLVLVAVGIAALEGALAGLTFAFFLFANPLFDLDFVGGAYLRADYLVALSLALVALRRGWLGASGAFFAVAGLLRIFPLVFPALLLLRDVLPADRAQRLRGRAKLHVSFAVTAVALLAITSLEEGPEGRNPWFDFTDNIRMHAGTLGGNQIGLQVPLRYTAAVDIRGGPEGTQAPPEWRPAVAQTLHERRLPLALCALVLIGVAFHCARREDDGEVFFAGLLLIFAILPLAHYYYAVLALTPLVSPGDRRRRLLLAATLLALTLSATPGLLPGSQDLHFLVYSLEVLAFLLIALWAGRGKRRLAGAAAAVALLAGSGCWQAGPPKSFVPIDGDVAVSHAMGFEITKPSDWVFLPISSLTHDLDRRAVTLEEIWVLFEDAGGTPMIQMADRPDPRLGVDLTVRVRVIPMKPGQSARAVHLITQHPMTTQVRFMRDVRRRFYPDVAELSAPEEATLGVRSAAKLRLGYTVEGVDGAPHAVVEQLYHTERAGEFWWVEMIGPAPLAPEVEQIFDQILASVRIDP